MVEFFTTWSPECKHITPTFSKLSERYTLPNLRFGKLDVGRYPKEGERFRINTHPASRQLPTIAVFKNSEQIIRRPTIGQNKRAIPFVFTEVYGFKNKIHIIYEISGELHTRTGFV